MFLFLFIFIKLLSLPLSFSSFKMSNSEKKYDIPGHFEGLSSLFVPMIGIYGTHPAFPGYTDLQIRHRVCRTWTNAHGMASLPDEFEGLVDAFHVREGVKFMVSDNMDRHIMEDLSQIGVTSLLFGSNVMRAPGSLATDLMFAVLTENASHDSECERHHDIERDMGTPCPGNFYGLTHHHAPLVQLNMGGINSGDDEKDLPKLNRVMVSYRQLVVVGTKEGDGEVIVDPESILEHLKQHWKDVTNSDQYPTEEDEEVSRKRKEMEDQEESDRNKREKESGDILGFSSSVSYEHEDNHNCST